MDLTKFTSQKKEKKKTLVDNKDISITQTGDTYSITPKTIQSLYNYQDELFFAPTYSLKTDDEEEAQKFFERALSQKTEGLMVKSLSSAYISGLRTGSMVKFKETQDDLDVVILAAEHGKGKRAGYYSSFYIGVISDEQYLTIGKVSSGIKELEGQGASMKNLTELLKPHKLSEKNSITYFEPSVIIQVRYQEIQPSTAYDSGYALRFPRIIMLREDKLLEEITTFEQITKLHENSLS